MANTSIKDLLDSDEKVVLEHIYKSYRVPTDQLRRCPDILHAIAAAFERLASRQVETGLLLRYMFNRRKDGDWPKLGKRAKKFSSLLNLLNPSQLSALEKVYEAIGKPVDAYQFNAGLLRELAEAFLVATGTWEDGEVLLGVMTARRKRELWPCLFEERCPKGASKGGGAFADIVEVDRMYKRRAAGA